MIPRGTWRVFLLSLTLATSLGAVEINGKVSAASGDTATIVLEGEFLPAMGDKVDIFFTDEGEEVSVATGNVSEVSGTSTTIKIEEATGTVSQHQIVRINSKNPQKRASITPASSPAAVEGAPPNEATRYAIEGLAKFDAKDFKGAIVAYNKSIELDPTDAKFYANRASVYNLLKQSKRALADVNEALRLDPTISMSYVIRADIYANLHQPKRAIADYDEAIRLDPKNVAAYFNRGNTYAEQGKTKPAIENFSQAIALNPNYKEAYWNRSACYKVIGKAELAKRDFAKFQELKARASSNSPVPAAP